MTFWDVVLELTGAAGIEPAPYTLRELQAIAAASYDRTAAIVASIAGLFDRTATVEKFNPYRQTRVRGSGDLTAKIHAVASGLPKWIPPE